MKPQRRNPLAANAGIVATVSETTAELLLSEIDRSGGTQIRLRLNEAKTTEYRDLIDGYVIRVHGLVYYDGSQYWLADGFHRFAGLEQLGMKTANVEVRAGTRRDAVLYAATEANNKHGLPLQPEEKRNAALTLLRDEEWSQWGDRVIARKVGITHPTVAKLRKQVEEEKSAEKTLPQPARRRVERGGTVYEMATAPIGSTPPAASPQPTRIPGETTDTGQNRFVTGASAGIAATDEDGQPESRISPSRRANVQQLRKATKAAIDALDSFPTRDAARILGTPFRQTHKQLMLQIQALSTMIRDQYGDGEN